MPDEGGFYGHGAWHPFTGAGTGTGSIMGPSGPDHAAGLAPDPGPIAGVTKYLREDATWAVPSGGGAGTGLTSVGLTMPAEFQVANSPLTQNGTLAVSTILEPPHFVWAGPVVAKAATGYWNFGNWDKNAWADDLSGYARPVFRLLEPADLPILKASGADHAAGIAPDPGASPGSTRYLREDATWAVPPGAGTGQGLTSVGLTMSAEFAVTNSPLTADGTINVSTLPQPPHYVWAGPPAAQASVGYWDSGTWDTNGWATEPTGYAAPVFRLLEPADLPLLKASGSGHAAGLAPDPGATAGSARFLCEDATWQVPSGTGTGLTSVGLTMPAEFTVANSPLTANGTIAVTSTAQSAHLVYVGPTTGSAQPTFRTLTSTDIPALAYVTSVGLAMPGDFTVANSPVTGANTLTVARVSQTAAQFLASPAAASGVPSYRGLTASDYPAFGGCGPAHAQGAVPDPGSVAGTTRFLREDGYWAQYAGGSIAVWDANVSLWG
jgi:hypothetical protein